MIARDSYIQKIIPFIDKPFVKVITGIRRCGKSTIMQLLATHYVQTILQMSKSFQ